MGVGAQAAAVAPLAKGCGGGAGGSAAIGRQGADTQRALPRDTAASFVRAAWKDM